MVRMGGGGITKSTLHQSHIFYSPQINNDLPLRISYHSKHINLHTYPKVLTVKRTTIDELVVLVIYTIDGFKTCVRMATLVVKLVMIATMLGLLTHQIGAYTVRFYSDTNLLLVIMGGKYIMSSSCQD